MPHFIPCFHKVSVVSVTMIDDHQVPVVHFNTPYEKKGIIYYLKNCLTFVLAYVYLNFYIYIQLEL